MVRATVVVDGKVHTKEGQYAQVIIGNVVNGEYYEIHVHCVDGVEINVIKKSSKSIGAKEIHRVPAKPRTKKVCETASEEPAAQVDPEA